LFPVTIEAQTLKLAIQYDGDQVQNSLVFKNGNIFKSKASSIVLIPVKSNDEIIIKHELYKDFSFQIPGDLKKMDTITKVVDLIPNFQVFDEFVVSSSKYQNVFKNENEFIIDYFPIPYDKFLVITHVKRSYYIKIIDESGNEKIKKKLAFKPKEIFLDAMGNFHLIEKDSVFQLYAEIDSIHIMPPISKYHFKSTLEELVLLSNDKAFYQKYTRHNQSFSVAEMNDKEVNNLYQCFDLEQYKTAVYHYNKVVNYYMRNTPEEDNIILMGIWDGNLMTLNNYDVEIVEMTTWSDKIASSPLNVKAFGLNDEIIILNGVRDSIVKIDNETLNLQKVKTKFSLTGEYYHDYFYDDLYMFYDDKKGTIVSKIDTDNGTLNKIIQITDIRQPRNVKVINNKVFFTVLDENGFNRIIKVNNQGG
jgi:hypothetical protein